MAESVVDDRQRQPARRHGAVGAVVVDTLGRVLLLRREIFRLGRYVPETRLPKGALQPRETDAAAALSEVTRLTGYDDLEVVADLGKAPVEYEARGVRYRRTEHYFLVKLRSLMKSDPSAPHSEDARLYTPDFVQGFRDAAAQLSFESEQGAVLRARAWWPG